MGGRRLRITLLTAVAAGALALPAAANADPTTTALSCQPSPVVLGAAASCTAEVADTVPPGFPTGSVSFSSAGPGGSFSSASCTLAALTGKSQCKVVFTPSALGSHSLTASYAGDPGFDPSEGSTSLTAVAPQKAKPKKCKKGRKLRKGKCVKKKGKRKR